MGQRACPVSAKEIYQTELYLGDSFRIGKPRHSVRFRHLLEANFEFGEVRLFAKFSPGSRLEAKRNRVRSPYLPRQGFKLIRDPYCFCRAPKK